MTLQQLINGLTQGSLFALLAISFAIIYGVLKLVNFATGALYMMGAYAGWMVVTFISENIFLALLAGAAMGWCLGFIIEKVAIKPVARSRPDCLFDLHHRVFDSLHGNCIGHLGRGNKIHAQLL